MQCSPTSCLAHHLLQANDFRALGGGGDLDLLNGSISLGSNSVLTVGEDRSTLAPSGRQYRLKAAEKAGEEGKKRRRRRKYKRKLDGDDGDDDGDDGDGGGGNDGDSDTADEAEDGAGGGERRATARESETELVSAVDRIFAPKVRDEL